MTVSVFQKDPNISEARNVKVLLVTVMESGTTDRLNPEVKLFIA